MDGDGGLGRRAKRRGAAGVIPVPMRHDDERKGFRLDFPCFQELKNARHVIRTAGVNEHSFLAGDEVNVGDRQAEDVQHGSLSTGWRSLQWTKFRCGEDVFNLQVRMVGNNLLIGQSFGNLAQDQLNGDSRALDDRLSKHDVWINIDAIVLHDPSPIAPGIYYGLVAILVNERCAIARQRSRKSSMPMRVSPRWFACQ